MFVAVISAIFFVPLFALTSVGAATCPAYEDIAQASVRPTNFSINEFSGLWYMIATNEPTLPSFCVCSVNDVQVHPSAGTYDYVNRDLCLGSKNVTLHIKGKLSNDSATPGLLHETAAIFNHTVTKLLPNYIFDVHRDASGAISTALTYACLGQIPIVGKQFFSFNVLARSSAWALADIQALVARASAATAGRLDVRGMRFNDEAAYRSCGFDGAAAQRRGERTWAR